MAFMGVKNKKPHWRYGYLLVSARSHKQEEEEEEEEEEKATLAASKIELKQEASEGADFDHNRTRNTSCF